MLRRYHYEALLQRQRSGRHASCHGDRLRFLGRTPNKGLVGEVLEKGGPRYMGHYVLYMRRMGGVAARVLSATYLRQLETCALTQIRSRGRDTPPQTRHGRTSHREAAADPLLIKPFARHPHAKNNEYGNPHDFVHNPTSIPTSRTAAVASERPPGNIWRGLHVSTCTKHQDMSVSVGGADWSSHLRLCKFFSAAENFASGTCG